MQAGNSFLVNFSQSFPRDYKRDENNLKGFTGHCMKNCSLKITFHLLMLLFCFGILWRCTQPKLNSVTRNAVTSAAGDAVKSGTNGISGTKNSQGTTLLGKGNSVDNGVATGTSIAAYNGGQQPSRHQQVSAFDLDSNEFLPIPLTVGLQSFLNTQTPVLNYGVSVDSDYVQIVRCPANAILVGPMNTINLQDVQLSSLSTAQRNSYYANNDFFTIAMKSGCSQLTMGTTQTTFYDAWVPSGSYRWLVRECVSPQRLTDIGNLTTRNCSRQVAISPLLKDFANTRDKTQSKYLQLANQDSANLLLSLSAAKQIADQYACYIQWCECGANPSQQSICQRDAKGVPTQCTGGEYGRAVDTAKKNAIVTLVAVGLDVAMNAALSGENLGLNAMKAGGFGAGMTVFGYLSSLGGWSFSAMFQALASQAQDFPHSCGKGISLNLQMSQAALAVQANQAQYNFDACHAKAAIAATNAIGGVSTSTTSSQTCPTTPNIPQAAPESQTTTSTGTGQ